MSAKRTSRAAGYALALVALTDAMSLMDRNIRIGLDAEECAVEFGRNCALVRQIYNIGFDPRGRIETGKAWRAREVRISPLVRLSL